MRFLEIMAGVIMIVLTIYVSASQDWTSLAMLWSGAFLTALQSASRRD